MKAMAGLGRREDVREKSEGGGPGASIWVRKGNQPVIPSNVRTNGRPQQLKSHLVMKKIYDQTQYAHLYLLHLLQPSQSI